MSIAIDEFGRPFILLKEQEKKSRVKGLEAIKSNITAAHSVSKTLRSSFGPKGLDKIIISPDGDVTVTNDGASILEKMDVEHEIAKLLVQLSQSQDDEIGDGTTGVVLLAGALLSEALPLLEKGIHPLKIAKGFELACDCAIEHLESISHVVDFAKSREDLIKTAETTLCSKFVNNFKHILAPLAVDAVLSVANVEQKDVNFEMIRVDGKVGETLGESLLVKGLILDKTMSHSQMKNSFENPKIALLTCAFEPPKPKTKHFVNISSVEQYEELYKQEQEYFRDMVKRCKDSGADIVFCQWGFDDEANHLLLQNEMPAVRWVGGVEMETLAIATGAKIVGRFEDLNETKLGTAGIIHEVTFGNSSDKMLKIENCPNTTTVTILLRAGNKMAVEEAKRSVHDSICVVRNLVKDNRIVYGGGSCEISCSQHVMRSSHNIKGLSQYGFKAFAKALLDIPLALAENAGYNAIEKLAELQRAQRESENASLGVNADCAATADMKLQSVFETFIGKRQQLQLATQLAKIVLKTDDIIKTEEEQY